MSRGTTSSGMRYSRAQIGGLTDAVQRASGSGSGSGSGWMMERGHFREHAEEDIVEFLDTSDRLFRNPDKFSRSIPAPAHRPQQQQQQQRQEAAAVLPSLRKAPERARATLREHPQFRYLLRGMPACDHTSEAALVLALRLQCGIERDMAEPRGHRFLFVRDDEKSDAAETPTGDAALPHSAAGAAYGAPPTHANTAFESFLAPETSDEDRGSILEDLGSVTVLWDAETFRVRDWWVEFGH